ncbi:ATP-binding protein, partial [Clostridium sp.]
GGSGLGLTITRQIIELHNGKIYVESKPGNGSKFTIILPI